MGDGEVQGAGEFAAGPVQGIQAGTATGVLAGHLLYDDLGVGEYVKSPSVDRNRVLQGFQQGDVLGDVVVLAADGFGDPHLFAARLLDDNANAGRSRTAMGPAINISD